MLTRTGPSGPRPRPRPGTRTSLKHAKGRNKDFTFALFKFSKKTDQSSDHNIGVSIEVALEIKTL